jgi:hypothetical protein
MATAPDLKRQRTARNRQPLAGLENLAELIHLLGDIPPERIRMHPLPGTATERDVLDALEAPQKRLCELVDGVLVEKTMGAMESI